MKKIISIDGGKGGTGKSVISCACIDVALSAGKKVLLIEADTSNPDVGKTYGEVVETAAIHIDDKEGFLALASALHAADAEVIVINNPARSGGWVTHGRLIVDNLGRIGAEMSTLWVANRQSDSLELLLDYAEALPEIPVHFVMNGYWGSPSRFEIWEASKLRPKILKAGGGELAFPDCADRVMHSMRTARMRWDSIESLEFGNLIEAERVRAEFTKILSPLICEQGV